MTKAVEAKLRAELKTLRAEVKTAKAPKRARRARKPLTTSRTAGFTVTDQIEKSEEYGVDYCHIGFVDAAGKGISEAPTADSDPLGFEAKEAIKAVRGGAHGRAKFRYDRKARAWSGQTALLPDIVLENVVLED